MNTVCASCQALNRLPDDRSADGAKCGRCGHDLFDGDVINATGATLDKLLKDDLPVVVDFWAPWCGPCKAIGPVIDELAAEFEGKVVIAKMNVDDNPATPGKFGIRAIPTLILFKGGEVVDQITGAVGKSQLQDLIKKAL